MEVVKEKMVDVVCERCKGKIEEGNKVFCLHCVQTMVKAIKTMFEMFDTWEQDQEKIERLEQRVTQLQAEIRVLELR